MKSTTKSGEGSNCSQYALALSFVDVLADLACMLAQQCALRVVVGLASMRFEVGGEGRLGVDDHLLARREA